MTDAVRVLLYRGRMSDERAPFRVAPVKEWGTRSTFGLYLLLHTLEHRGGDTGAPVQWYRAVADLMPVA